MHFLFNRILVTHLLGLTLLGLVSCQLIRDRERGAFIGNLSTLNYEVSGSVWALDDETYFIERFSYNGMGPDAFFWMGAGNQPNPQGFIIPYPMDDRSDKVLPKISAEDLVLKLPTGKKISDYKWFSVWCRRFTVNFGSVLIPPGLVVPKKRMLPEFKRLAHGVRSGNITILDSKTFYVPNLHYDGAGPDAFFWVGKGEPSPKGRKIPNEVGSLDVLRSYEGEDIELQLPDDLTVYDIDYLSIWCVAYRHDFGHVVIPQEDLWVIPSKGQTAIRPKVIIGEDKDIYDVETNPLTPQFPNCLELSSDLQVEWEPRRNDIQIRITARIEENEYVAFGVSGSTNKATMINSDVVVVYYNSLDRTFNAVDYSITSKSQCDGIRGVCPDENGGHGRNDASVITGERKDGITTVTYSRPYSTQDRFDIAIPKTPAPSTIIAAIGPLNTKNQANYHQKYVTKELVRIDFSSKGRNQCAQLTPTKPRVEYQPWDNEKLIGVTNFTVNIGPTGGDKGYKAITGFASWGIAWWVNGLLIPEIYVERGLTYYFTVEGGDDPSNGAKYHPLYITDSEAGGYQGKTMEEKSQEKLYAGVAYTNLGSPIPTAQGRLCEFEHNSGDKWKESRSLRDYTNTLYRECEAGLPGTLEWTVPENAPDLLYYQCYTHRHLGWKIHVTDPGANQIFAGQSGTEPLKKNLLLFVGLLSFIFFTR